MKTLIETLEGRRLLAGNGPGAGLLAKAEGVDDAAVQATLVLIEEDKAAIQSAREQLRSDTSDSRLALKETIQSGFELLASDRQAVRDAKDDPDALAAAREKLKADREQIREDIAAAREALRSDSADARADLKAALESLGEHLKQLRTDLQNAGAIPVRPKPDENGNYTLTPEQAQTAVDKINAAADSVDTIDQDAVDKLTADLTAAASDSSITPEERQLLGEDVRAVLTSIRVRDLFTLAREIRGAVPLATKLSLHG
jgi:DNA repair exonuclease SbcCD ATPase subunit